MLDASPLWCFRQGSVKAWSCHVLVKLYPWLSAWWCQTGMASPAGVKLYESSTSHRSNLLSCDCLHCITCQGSSAATHFVHSYSQCHILPCDRAHVYAAGLGSRPASSRCNSGGSCTAAGGTFVSARRDVCLEPRAGRPECTAAVAA